MSNIELRAINNGVKITGIVHKIGTASKMLRRKGGQFIEKFSKEAWEEAITENNEIRLLVNHDTKQSYATTKNGTLSLWIEDNDVKMDAIIYDKELAEEIRAYGDGFSFGFTQKEEKWEDADGYSIRSITKALISEVSVLINSRPAYGGTLVEVRSAENGPDYIEVAETNLLSEVRSMDFESEEFKAFADKLFEMFQEKQKALQSNEETVVEEEQDTKQDEVTTENQVEETTEEATEEVVEEVVEEVIEEDKQDDVIVTTKASGFDYELLVNMIVEKLKPAEQTQEDTNAVSEESEVEDKKEDDVKEEEQTKPIDEEVQKFLESLQNQKEVIEDEA